MALQVNILFLLKNPKDKVFKRGKQHHIIILTNPHMLFLNSHVFPEAELP